MPRSRRVLNRATAPALLTDQVLALQKSLSLRVNAIATSLLHGTHPSVVAGRGMEADSVRPYQPGDDPRRIDWRVTARKGPIHVREFSAEKNLPTLVVLQRTSTLHAGRGGIKGIRAKEICALLAAVGVAQGDRVGLVVSPVETASLHPLQGGRIQLEMILRRLLEEDGSAPDSCPREALGRVRAFLRQRSRVYIVSDFQVGEEELTHLRHGLLGLAGRHNVIPVHLTDRGEGRLPQGTSCLWEDPLTGFSREGGRFKADRDLSNALDVQRRQVQALFHDLGLDCWSFDVEEDLTTRLLFFLSRTKRRNPTPFRRPENIRRVAHG